jgi:hypothetical protein
VIDRRAQVLAGGIILAVVGIGVTALWLRFNVEPPGRGFPFPHDLVYYFLPQLDQVGRRLASFELPLWNPAPCTGVPLLASLQVEVFYPSTWLAAFLPAEQVLPIIVFLHLLLGGVSSALLFRAWGLRPVLAGALAVVFVYACLLGQSFWPPEVVTLAWVPLSLLCTERIMASRRADGWWLGLAAVVALQLLAGFPQFAVYGLQLVALLGLLRAVQGMRRGAGGPALRAGGRVVGALVLGAGIAMVQLLPSLELLSASQRSERPSEDEVEYLQRDARLPRILANALDPAPRLTTYEIASGTGYLGIGTLVLAGLALAGRRRDPLVWLLAAAGGFWLLMADGYLGSGSGIYRVYAMLPAIGLFRAPERLLFASYLCWIALAALGAVSVDRAGDAPRARRIALGATALLFAAGVALAGAPGAGWRAALAAGWVAGALALPAAWRGPWRSVAAFLLIADVLAATGTFGSLRDVPEEFAEGMRAGPLELASSAQLASLRERAGLSRVEFVAPLARVRPLMGIGDAGDLNRLACYAPLLPEQWSALSQRAHSGDHPNAAMSNLDPLRVPAIYDAASVVTIVRAARTHRSPERRRVEILENRDALPRAYLVDSFEVVPTEAALDRLVRGEVDLEHGVLLDAEPGFEPAGAIARAIPAEIVSLAPERVEIMAHSPGPALLVLTDTDAPGWTAAVNGKATTIHRANGLFRAVRVGAGEQHVVFRYAPVSLRVGALLSLASVVTAAAIWIRARH